MSPELDKKLCDDFPILYSMRNKSMTETAMCWGFSCGDGWYNLIYDLSKKITEEIMKYSEEDRTRFHANQVKEKFGTLHFYMNVTNDVIDKAIEEAEAISEVTCEVCGKEGKLNKNKNWYRTVCEEHAK